MSTVELIRLYTLNEIRSNRKNKYLKLFFILFFTAVCYISIYIAENVINKSKFLEYLSNGSFYTYSLLSMLLVRIIFQNPTNFDLFTLKKLGISEQKINTVFPIISQLNLYNIFFAFVGLSILLTWADTPISIDIFLLVLTILITNQINSILKYFVPKYFILLLLIIPLLFPKLLSYFKTSLYFNSYAAYYILLLLVIYLVINLIAIKSHQYTLSYDYYRNNNPSNSLFQISKNLTWSWTVKDFLLLLRVKRMKNSWISFILILFIYTSYTNRSYNENSIYSFFYTLFSLIFLGSYYGQNCISWDSSNLSLIFFASDKNKIQKYVNGKYLSMVSLITISFIVLFIINSIRLTPYIELIKLSILYLYSAICLPPLFLYFGLSNNFNINLREKSILSHWNDRTSMPQASFFMFIIFTCMIYFIFDWTISNTYAYVIFLVISLIILLLKKLIITNISNKLLKIKQLLFEKLTHI